MFLGLDIGTTNVKALVMGPKRERLASGSVPAEVLHTENGGVEQNIDQLWAAACSAIREALSSVDATKIQAIGVSSQGGALQLLDAEGKPAGRVISWLDQRGKPFNDELAAKMGEQWFLERIGHRGPGLATGQVMRLAKSRRASTLASGRVGFVGDEIVRRLTGRAAHDGTSAGLTLLYNPLLRDYDPDVLRLIGLSKTQLPEILAPTTPAGSVTDPASQATGIPVGIPVSCAIHDQYAAALGCGAIRAGATMVGTGTAWVLLAVGSALTQPASRNCFACHHVVDDLYGQIVSMVNGGSAIAWACRLTENDSSGTSAVDGLLETVPAGSAGLCFWPFLAAGNPAGAQRGGRLAGLQLSHSAGHLVRAVVEGLAFELRRHLLMLDQAGIPTTRLILSGSAASSRVTPRIIADVAGLPVQCASAAGSIEGAAILARALVSPGVALAAIAEETPTEMRQTLPGSNQTLYAERFADYMSNLPMIR